MTVVRNEPSFVSIIGKLDAMSFQLETKEFLIYDLPRIPFHFLATKNTLNIASAVMMYLLWLIIIFF